MKRMKIKISSKRQITLPAELCRELGIAPGEELEVAGLDQEIVISRVVDPDPIEDFDAWLETVAVPGLYGGDAVEYARRVRDGGDIDHLPGDPGAGDAAA